MIDDAVLVKNHLEFLVAALTLTAMLTRLEWWLLKSRTTKAAREAISGAAQRAWKRLAALVDYWQKKLKRDDALSAVLANYERVKYAFEGACEVVEYRPITKKQQPDKETVSAEKGRRTQRRSKKGRDTGADFAVICALVVVNLGAIGFLMWLLS